MRLRDGIGHNSPAMDHADAYCVTGGTGFIGRHLIDELLRRPAASVFVLVRERSRARFDELAAVWNAAEPRVFPVTGNLVAPDLDLAPKAAAELRGRVGHFFHVAGLYDMAARESVLTRTNVIGTRNALDAAARMGARCFHHVSSIAVAGRYPGVFHETMFTEATGLDDPYFQTKHAAERLVRAERALPWRIYRPALVVGHSKTGAIDKVDGPYYLFPLLERLAAALPQILRLPGIEGGFLNLVPVDFVAAAIAHIAHRPDLDGRTFHLVDPKTRSLGRTLDVLADAAGAPRFSLRAPRRLERALGPALHLLTRDGAIATVLARLLGMPPRVLDYVTNPTMFDCRETLAALADSAIAVPPLESYARVLWTYWEHNLNTDTTHGRALERAVRGKVVLITGASAGIGRATALKLAAAGAQVLLVARGAERLEEVRRLVERTGGRATTLPADLTDDNDVTRLCRTVLERFGGIDVLINNAGRSIRRSLQLSENRFHDFARTVDINYFGAVRLILAFLPSMRERGGHIVNVSSMGVQVHPPRFAAYIASKAALDAFSRCAAPELLGDGVDITTVYMPLVKTDMIAPTRLYDSFSAMTPTQAADLICGAVVRRPKRVSTALGVLSELTAGVVPNLYDVGLHLAFRLFPESAAARGETAHSEERPGNLARVFARLLPGVHW